MAWPLQIVSILFFVFSVLCHSFHLTNETRRQINNVSFSVCNFSRKMDNVNQANYDYLADIQDILLKMDGKWIVR